MDLLDVLILVLRLALVALLFLFVLAVLRASRDMLVRAPRERPAVTGEPRSSVALPLAVLDPAGSGLHAGEQVLVASGATIGRSPQCELVLADGTVSGLHARVQQPAPGRWEVLDLGSTNGTLVNEKRVSTREVIGPGDVLRLGDVQLQVIDGSTSSRPQ